MKTTKVVKTENQTVINIFFSKSCTYYLIDVHIFMKKKVHIIYRNVIQICSHLKHVYVHLLDSVQLFTKLPSEYVHFEAFMYIRINGIFI